jgi:hypothetical protein
MDIEKLIDKIIPPCDYQNRNGFNNIPLLKNLSNNEKKQVESALIDRVSNNRDEEIDILIVETLAYLKSFKSLPLLMRLLERCSNDLIKLKIAASIFELNQDRDMVNIAINSFKKLDNNKDAYYVYKITSAFFYLIKFKTPEVNNIIKEYINHKEYLVAYNAKRALGIR